MGHFWPAGHRLGTPDLDHLERFTGWSIRHLQHFLFLDVLQCHSVRWLDRCINTWNAYLTAAVDQFSFLDESRQVRIFYIFTQPFWCLLFKDNSGLRHILVYMDMAIQICGGGFDFGVLHWFWVYFYGFLIFQEQILSGEVWTRKPSKYAHACIHPSICICTHTYVHAFMQNKIAVSPLMPSCMVFSIHFSTHSSWKG